jgi:hypothetical protein
MKELIYVLLIIYFGTTVWLSACQQKEKVETTPPIIRIDTVVDIHVDKVEGLPYDTFPRRYFIIGWYAADKKGSYATGEFDYTTTNPIIPQRDTIIKWIRCAENLSYKKKLIILSMSEMKEKDYINFIKPDVLSKFTDLDSLKCK